MLICHYKQTRRAVRALAIVTELHLLNMVHMFHKYGVACSHHQQEKEGGGQSPGGRVLATSECG